MHYYPVFYSQSYSPFGFGSADVVLPLLAIAAIWSIVLKGFALWHASRNNQKWWFIALLVINTLGILEIVYLIWFRPTSSYYYRKSAGTPAGTSSTQA